MDYNKLKVQARAALEGRWGIAIGVFVAYLIISAPLQAIPKTGGVLSIFLTSALLVGYARFNLNMAQNLDPGIEDLFWGFKQYGRSLGAFLLMLIYVLLWTLLLIIPGIIAAYSYSQVSFILAEDDTIGVKAALAKSKKMMDGYKLDLFMLHLSFLGWALLCILTVGIGFLWLSPWAQVTFANFYLDVKTNRDAKGEVLLPQDAPMA